MNAFKSFGAAPSYGTKSVLPQPQIEQPQGLGVNTNLLHSGLQSAEQVAVAYKTAVEQFQT